VKERVANWIGSVKAPEDFSWGTFGPQLMTAMVTKFDCHALVSPSAAVYPLPYPCYEELLNPAYDPAHRFTSDTLAIHLWATLLRRRLAGQTPPKGSWLRTRLDEYMPEVAA